MFWNVCKKKLTDLKKYLFVLSEHFKVLIKDFCEPDPETLTSDTENQLARGIQSKTDQSLEVDLPVEG